MTMTVVAVQHDALVADNARGPIDRGGVYAPCVEVRLRAGHEETACRVQCIEASEVRVCPVHDVKRSGLRNKQVEHIDVVPLSVRDMNEAGYCTSEIQKCVNFDCCFGLAEWSPWKNGKTKIDGSGVQRINRIGEIESEILACIQPSCLSNQSLCKIGVDALVAGFVCVGQSRAGNRSADAHMVELRRLSRQACLYIAQTLPIRQLGEGQDTKLLRATEAANTMVAPITSDNTMKCAPRKKIHDLGK